MTLLPVTSEGRHDLLAFLVALPLSLVGTAFIFLLVGASLTT